MEDEELKVGAVVAVIGREGVDRITKIVRVTKTQLIDGDNGRWNRRTQRPVGAGPWNQRHIEMATPQHAQERHRKRLLGTIRDTAMPPLTTDQLDRIVAILNEDRHA